MAGLLARLKAYSRTPQGRRNIATARRAAADPRNRAKARSLLGRLRGGRR
ncbi:MULTISPECIES: hypothetical protein [Streptomyces]|uniref:Uncharacterized protein n=1 Tax=Streptomyces alfalfae TaxID=1642299 RepID=A0A7T4PMX3_9ACTN|nr:MULTISPECIES: hypothetical protein [Streptomyces]QQC93176.1 hypothetical protein I8755_36210 [Streptomyces alfalfae]QUI35486.1 hypothetical protein H9W91_35175 [Streptomyces alfalfae]